MEHGVADGLSKPSVKPSNPTLQEDNSGVKPPGLGPSGPPTEKEKHVINKRSGNKQSTRTILVVLKNSNYKEIKHIQAFNIESWVGNVGGYVGLFLGCALWQAPDFIDFVFRKMKGIVNTISGVKNKNAFFVEGNKN